MLPQLIRWTVLFGLWKKFRRQIVLTGTCVIALVFISIVHQDFIAYQSSLTEPNEQMLAWSFAIKWMLYLLVLGAYWFLFGRLGYENASSLHAEMAELETHKKTEKKSARLSEENEPGPSTNESDPFANIRTKKKLRSKAEIIIDNKLSKD